MKYNKCLKSHAFVFAVAAIIVTALFIPVSGYATDSTDQELIMQLKAQITALQRQINNLPPQQEVKTTAPAVASQPPAASSGALQTAQPVSVSQKPAESSGDEPTTPPSFNFSRDLFFGLRGDADVTNLQEFLSEHGHYSGQATGNFFLLTLKAVKKFQSANGISPTGYFGPKSRAIANNIISQELGSSGGGNTSSQGSLSIEPSSAHLAVGESIRIKAMFAPPRPACLDATPPCMIPEQMPYDVDASFESSNPGVAAIGERVSPCEIPPCPVSPSVRGVSAGSAVITASYRVNAGADPLTAQAKVTVTGDTSINYDACRLDLLDGSNITRNAIEDKTQCLVKLCDIYGPANLAKGTELKCVFRGMEIKRYTKSSSITMLSPNGGETWTKGTTQTIKWQDNTPVPTSPPCLVGATCPVYSAVRFYDLKLAPYYPPCTGITCPAYPNRAPYTVANSVHSSSYSWSVGQVIPAGQTAEGYPVGSVVPDGSYTVQVCQSGTNTCDSSDSYFKIVSGAGTNSSPVINGIPAIPSDIKVGQSVSFSWGATDADGDNLSWSVSWGDGTGMAGACASPNPQNKQGWAFTASHAWGNPGTYTVKATVNDCNGGMDTNIVTISVGSTNTPSVTVVSPNGGEQLNAGYSYDITWKNSGASYVGLFLMPSGEAITPTIAAINAPFRWTVPYSVSIGSNYRVQARLYTLDSTGRLQLVTSDDSDAPFSITNPPAVQ